MAKRLTNEQRLVRQLLKLPWEFEIKLVETAEGNMWLASVKDFDPICCTGMSEEDALLGVKHSLEDELTELVRSGDEFQLPFMENYKLEFKKK